MNDRTKANSSTAMGVVSESLGLNLSDLGTERNEDSFITDTDDDLEDDDNDEGDDETNLEGEEGEESDDGEDDLDPEPQPQPQSRDKQQQKPQKKGKDQDDLSVTHTQDEFAITGFKYDKQGNIVKDGKIVANKGREARLFTTLHKERGEANTLRNTAQQAISSYKTRMNKAIEIGTRVAQELRTLKEQGSIASRAGLSDQELNSAVELASMYKRDRVGAIKMMLTRAAASGIDLTTLGLQPGGFDTQSLMTLIQQEIGKAVQPIQQINNRETEQQRLAREQQEAEATATEQLNEFLFQNPEAKRYLPAIQKIYQNPEFQHMSLNEVWLQIQLNQLRNPRRRQQPDGDRQQRSRNRQEPRIPDGSRRLGGGGQDREPQSEMADVSESYEDIVKGVLRRTG